MTSAMMEHTAGTLVYSCSGGANVAQMANWIATRLDRSGHAEMSSVVGIGGHVPSLVELAKSGRPILAIDGCHLHCAAKCLALQEISARYHITLTKFGIRKRSRIRFKEDDAAKVYGHIVDLLDGCLRPDQPWVSRNSRAPTTESRCSTIR